MYVWELYLVECLSDKPNNSIKNNRSYDSTSKMFYQHKSLTQKCPGLKRGQSNFFFLLCTGKLHSGAAGWHCHHTTTRSNLSWGLSLQSVQALFVYGFSLGYSAFLPRLRLNVGIKNLIFMSELTKHFHNVLYIFRVCRGMNSGPDRG